MIPHVHTPNQNIETWGVNGMKAHLERAHPEVSIPMRWGRAELHEAHLKAHQAPEEKPVTVCHHQCPDGPVTCTYTIGHAKLTDPADQTGMVIYGEFDHGNYEEDMWWVESRTNAGKDGEPIKVFVGKDGFEIGHVNRPENPQVLVDRLICVLADVDFDQEWVPDNGLGPSARGAFRRVWAAPAEALLRWLEHGGALHLPAVASLATDLEREQSLVEDLEAANNDLREQLATTSRQLIEAQNERDLLRADKARLKADLETAQKLQHAAESDRDKTAEDLRLRKNQWDRVVPHLESRLTARTEALATGQAALRNLLQGLNQGMVPLTSGAIMFQLEAILAGQGPQVSTCTEPHLGLATTREILAELTARIEVGHTGLDYRTVDDH